MSETARWSTTTASDGHGDGWCECVEEVEETKAERWVRGGGQRCGGGLRGNMTMHDNGNGGAALRSVQAYAREGETQE